MDAVRKNQLYTIDDIYSLPNGIRAELLDGAIYNMESPRQIQNSRSTGVLD